VAPFRGEVIVGLGTTQGGSVVGGAVTGGAVTGSGAAVAAGVPGVPGVAGLPAGRGAGGLVVAALLEEDREVGRGERSGGSSVPSGEVVAGSMTGAGSATPLSIGGAVAGSVAATVVVEA
jgi:hypothetical protein